MSIFIPHRITIPVSHTSMDQPAEHEDPLATEPPGSDEQALYAAHPEAQSAHDAPNRRRGGESRSLLSRLTEAATYTVLSIAAVGCVALNNSETRHWTLTNAAEIYNMVSANPDTVRLCFDRQDVNHVWYSESQTGTIHHHMGAPLGPLRPTVPCVEISKGQSVDVPFQKDPAYWVSGILLVRSPKLMVCSVW